jgi:hypothetical protein
MRSLVLVLFLLAGCTRTTVIVTPDGGALDAASLDAALLPDTGPLPEPTGGSECDQQDDCGSCLRCTMAPREECSGPAVACDLDPECAALSACVNGCTAGEGCVAACGAAHPSATAAFLRMFDCMICHACPADCRELGPTWCQEPPF